MDPLTLRLRTCIDHCDRCTGRDEGTPTCGETGARVLPHARDPAAVCPLGRWAAAGEAPARSAPPAESQEDRRARAGRALWAELHRRAAATTDLAGESAWAEMSWLARFADRVPSLGCSCRSHWRQIVAADPPDLSSPAAYFEWTWQAHNAVNAKLGKPCVTLGEARALWG